MRRGPLLRWNASVYRYRRKWTVIEGGVDVDLDEVTQHSRSKNLDELLRLGCYDLYPTAATGG